jgi:Ser/Thr protein kinase RdoA (MazF antagonist)
MTSDFGTHDDAERMARLETLAREALEAFGLPGAALSPHAHTNNAVFRADDRRGSYLLRIHRPGLKRLAWIRSELAWLEAIRRETGLCVPEPAGPVYSGALPDVDGPVYCVLLGWLEGQPTAPEMITRAQAEALGAFAGRLHDFAARFIPPPEFERPRLDWEGLFGADSPYYSAAEAGYFTAEMRAVLDEAATRAGLTMAALDAAGESFGLIHADLIAKNVLFNGETVCAIDFDDCAYGYYLYDLTPLLWACRADPRYEVIQDALWRGYTAARPLPEELRPHLETLVAARHVASCRWVAGNAGHPAIRGRVAEILAGRIEELRGFLTTGRLRTA